MKKVAKHSIRATEEAKPREEGRFVADVGEKPSPLRIFSLPAGTESQQKPQVNTYATRYQLKQALLAETAADKGEMFDNFALRSNPSFWEELQEVIPRYFGRRLRAYRGESH